MQPLSICLVLVAYVAIRGACLVSPTNPTQTHEAAAAAGAAAVHPLDQGGGGGGGTNQSTMKLRVGYYGGWTSNQVCDSYPPEQIDAKAWTHLHFAFGGISVNNEVEFLNDDDRLVLERLAAYRDAKNKDLNVILSLGGWNYNNPGETQNRFTTMVSTPSNREAFAKSVLSLLQKYGLNGIDLDWQLPTLPERGGRLGDAVNYVATVQVLRETLPKQYSVSVAAPASLYGLKGMDIKGISDHADYIVSLTYDFQGTWSYPYRPTLVSHSNLPDVQSAIQLMVSHMKVPAHKLVLGLAFFGHAYQLADPSCGGSSKCYFTKANVPGETLPQSCAGDKHTWSLKQLQRIRNDPKYHVTTGWDEESYTNWMIVDNATWIDYEDARSLRRKVALAKEKGLAGYMVWAVDEDLPENELAQVLLQAATTKDTTEKTKEKEKKEEEDRGDRVIAVQVQGQREDTDSSVNRGKREITAVEGPSGKANVQGPNETKAIREQGLAGYMVGAEDLPKNEPAQVLLQATTTKEKEKKEEEDREDRVIAVQGQREDTDSSVNRRKRETTAVEGPLEKENAEVPNERMPSGSEGPPMDSEREIPQVPNETMPSPTMDPERENPQVPNPPKPSGIEGFNRGPEGGR